MKIHLDYPIRASAIVLDMDGVLVDTEPLHLQSFRDYLTELGIDYEEAFLESFIGYSVEENLKTINRKFLSGREIPIPEAVKRRDAFFIGLLNRTPLEPARGFDAIISRSRRLNFRLALASSSVNEHIEIILDNLSRHSTDGNHYRAFFAAVTGGDEVRHKKPEPDIYNLTVEKLNLSAGECVAVEDSYAGILSAKKAGLSVIGLRNPYIDESKLAEADAVIDSLQEIAEAIDPVS
jgi:beta-phosphoglucomutase-like phosphatase (HAD superfamily)